MHIEIPIHLWQETLAFKTCFFENSLGCDIVRMGESFDFSEPETFVREHKREPRQLGGVTFTPCCRGEVIANFDSPTNVERIIIKTAKTDYRWKHLFEYDPGSISDLPTLAFVRDNVAATCAKTDEPARVSHCFFVTKDV